ncbi:hypothetical protein P7K49_034736 [Saguinus oedipus]|uniref:Uncharacterized protein n=1 Tax=Saguinus oedipus TaxID=9490 RepID=A0ABQ9TVM9_SAGOE|nr:hypothetical protein P7K49_034736 [Saguinus oedipus]
MPSVTVDFRTSTINMSEIASGFYTFNKFDVDQHVDDPEEKERGGNAGREFRFKPGPFRMTGTDGDGLKRTQESGGADGKTPGNSTYIQNCFAANIIQKFSHSKGCCNFRDQCEHGGENINPCEMHKNQMDGLPQARVREKYVRMKQKGQ